MGFPQWLKSDIQIFACTYISIQTHQNWGLVPPPLFYENECSFLKIQIVLV